MTNGFDLGELTKYQKDIIKLAKEKMPKEEKKFLRSEGTKLKKQTLNMAKASVKKDTGKYFKSIKRGKVYEYKGTGALSVRVYSSAPHAHLLEYGHRQVLNPGKGEGNGKGVIPGKGIGKEIGFVRGFHVFNNAAVTFNGQYYNDGQEFIDELLRKGLY